MAATSTVRMVTQMLVVVLAALALAVAVVWASATPLGQDIAKPLRAEMSVALKPLRAE
jgi:hypothetical protein